MKKKILVSIGALAAISTAVGTFIIIKKVKQREGLKLLNSVEDLNDKITEKVIEKEDLDSINQSEKKITLKSKALITNVFIFK